MKRKSKTETALVLICAAQVLHENMDDLIGTDLYRQNVKQHAKRLEEELTKHYDQHIQHVFKEDEETANLIMSGIEKYAKILAKLTPEALAKINFILDEVNKD
jgi:hypothetical protein